ncbi:unnamed protein product [Cylindrotheca closterium]|uniref:Integrase catalytic domain-containing protein n=3 Tax=Cylindrotheca closterium TaxID=2856 RepID=A0AAD2FST1_9STRA|nr:unnamed protein product [Cylindrotheca closterium]
MAGHVGFHKTYYRIAARFWWPGMAKDIREAVLGCGHCNAAYASSHKNQKILQQTPIEEPFDVYCMDVWSPGSTKNATKLSTTLTKTLTNKGVVTYVCNMTVAFISSMNSGNMARIAFLQFFTVRGLPRLILIDEGSENKDQFTALCDTIGIAYHTVSPENHDGILCERFHKYLNKVQQIGAADMNTYEEWAMNTLFGTYAWNAAPVDDTDIQRAFAAVARHFKFPLDNAAAALSISEARQKNRTRHQQLPGQNTLEHIETMFPLFWRQKELLKLLNEEQREHHRMLKNQTRTRRKFDIGDIVMVRKQVQSNASAGIPAKLVLRTKGPYRFIEKASEDSYRLQKIPGTSTMLKKRGSTPIKESAFRMHKIPSTTILHKGVDTPDTRLANMRSLLAHSPLEMNLGLVDFGKYATTPTDTENAFEPIKNIWDEEVDPMEDSSDEEEDNTPTPSILDAIQRTQPRPINRDIPPTDTEGANQTRQVHTTETITEELNLRSLYERTTQSKDKLYVIAHQDNTSGWNNWYVIQINMEETNEKLARTKGQYHCKEWYIPKLTTTKQGSPMTSPFWPLIKEFTDETTYGPTVPIRHSKVDQVLNKSPHKYAWFQKEVNIVEDGVYGPFDFERDYKIPDVVWEKVREAATQMKLKVANITPKSTPPGRAHKRARHK